MPDWNEINNKKRREINLGMAKNGAIQLLKPATNNNWVEAYKTNVRLLFALNEKLDCELLEPRAVKPRISLPIPKGFKT